MAAQRCRSTPPNGSRGQRQAARVWCLSAAVIGRRRPPAQMRTCTHARRVTRARAAAAAAADLATFRRPWSAPPPSPPMEAAGGQGRPGGAAGRGASWCRWAGCDGRGGGGGERGRREGRRGAELARVVAWAAGRRAMRGTRAGGRVARQKARPRHGLAGRARAPAASRPRRAAGCRHGMVEPWPAGRNGHAQPARAHPGVHRPNFLSGGNKMNASARAGTRGVRAGKGRGGCVGGGPTGWWEVCGAK